MKGSLNVVRPRQGYPVIVQAGASEDGQDFAAQTAEVIFTAQQTLEEAQAFYAGIKERLAKYGRLPDRLKIMPGVFPVIGHTEKEAKEKLVTDLARRENLTIRQLYQAIAGARGHWTIWGTPEPIIDRLEEWFINDAADGFNLMPPYLPGGLDDFVDLVLPILRRRGLFRMNNFVR